MPQRAGYHPFTFLYVTQYYQQLRLPGGAITNVLKVRFFIDQASHDAFLQNPGAGKSIAADYGRQKWFNSKHWMKVQLDDLEINDNFVPNLPP